MNIQIINGPNLNLLGVREKSIYGDADFITYFNSLQQRYPEHTLTYYQTNKEGEIINKLHEQGFSADGIILNAGGYTHTSVAIADAIAAVTTPVIEVHISNVYKRESFRHKSMLAASCRGVIAGFGLDSYRLALENFLNQ